ncbi:MAG: winged helix DNA-binding protein [Alloprevotella sp.]|nr:winged helix DNA-binding protein [Alloprevotella sp.]
MEHQHICQIRDLINAIATFEDTFAEQHGLNIHEAMLLCILLENSPLTGSDIANLLGFKTSHSSKIIRKAENSGWIIRAFGDIDRRQVFFSLSPKGQQKIKELKMADIELPALLKQCINADSTTSE